MTPPRLVPVPCHLQVCVFPLCVRTHMPSRSAAFWLVVLQFMRTQQQWLSVLRLPRRVHSSASSGPFRRPGAFRMSSDEILFWLTSLTPLMLLCI